MAEALLKIQTPNDYSGKQVLIKSDRLVFNASTNDILLASKNIIAIGASNELHLNSGGNMYLNVKKGSRIVLGKAGTDRKREQEMVLGKSLSNFLDDIMQLLITFQVTTPSGEGQAGPKVAQQIQKIKNKYLKKGSKDYILSDSYFIADNLNSK